VSIRERWADRLAVRLLLGFALSATCGVITPALAESAVPDNARASEFGAGWDCVWGGGDGWLCERGFRQVLSACIRLNVPPNGYVDYTGNEWRCVDGFRKQAGACVSE
jgi:hypothetical protein